MATFASHSRASHWSDKNILQPTDVPLYYYKKFWFNCDVCPHEFKTNLNSIARLNTWCPYCSNKKLCDSEDCKICYDKSFASSDKVECWSNKNIVNPRTVFKSSNKSFIFNCNICSNEFTSLLNNITAGKWCKLCGYASSISKQSMKIEEFLKRAKEKYGILYDYSKVIMNGVDRIVIIICNTHGEFEQTPWNHYRSEFGGCPICTIIKRGENNRYTFSEFVQMAKSIHGDKFDYSKAASVYISLKEKIPIICKIHGEFLQRPSSHLRRASCPFCYNKTEGQLLNFLKKYYTDVFTQLKLESCKNITYLPFDFCIPSLKIIIELDGIQHFKQVSNWASPEKSIQRDIYKMKQAEAEGYKIIRLFQEDVYDNDETWLETNLLPEIKNTDRNHMFISALEDLYDEHIRVYEEFDINE